MSKEETQAGETTDLTKTEKKKKKKKKKKKQMLLDREQQTCGTTTLKPNEKENGQFKFTCRKKSKQSSALLSPT